MILQGKHVVLGVTGGIACYKALDLCSRLVQAGAVVDVVMTEAATAFVTPLPFQTLTRRPVSVDAFQLLRDMDMAHISLAARAGVLVIAPATANTIAKLACGLADNLLTSTALACTAPLLVAPAMDSDMWANPVTQENVSRLRDRGAVIVGPGIGRLASGRVGVGRLVEIDVLVGAIRQVLGRGGPLMGARVLVTAGGTQEPLDPVRHLTNRSSGKMGYALAEAARDAGATVTLVSAPVSLAAPFGVDLVSVKTAAQMAQEVLGRVAATDILVMAAAVADFRPAAAAAQKIKKAAGQPTIVLEPTEDILASVSAARGRGDCNLLVVGFAAETENLLENAEDKLAAKRLDLIVANDVALPESGFEVDDNRVTLLEPGQAPVELPLMSKVEVAERVMARVAALWKGVSHA